MVLDDAGNKVNNYTYDAWGNTLTKTETVPNPIRYAGQYYDEELEQYYLRARYYDPQVGRFTSIDAVRGDISNPLDLNQYVYCRNNPVRYVDPTGFITVEEQQMYENGQMAPMAYSYMMNLTYQWWLADSQSSRDTYHQWAEDFRASGYSTTNGLFPEVDAGIAYMPTKPTGGITKEQHYFRNKLNLQFSWSTLQILQNRLPNGFKWDDSVAADLHQNIALSSGPNVKFVSACGHFEIVYNANHQILGEHNAPSDMGTYNYSNPKMDSIGHYIHDIYSYRSFGWFGWGYGNVE